MQFSQFPKNPIFLSAATFLLKNTLGFGSRQPSFSESCSCFWSCIYTLVLVSEAVSGFLRSLAETVAKRKTEIRNPFNDISTPEALVI
jgi:hypothetical protein